MTELGQSREGEYGATREIGLQVGPYQRSSQRSAA